MNGCGVITPVPSFFAIASWLELNDYFDNPYLETGYCDKGHAQSFQCDINTINKGTGRLVMVKEIPGNNLTHVHKNSWMPKKQILNIFKNENRGKQPIMVFSVFPNHMTTAMTSLQLASFWIIPQVNNVAAYRINLILD